MRKSLTEKATFEKSLEGRERGSHEVSRVRAFPAGSGSMPGGQGEGSQRGWRRGKETTEEINEVGEELYKKLTWEQDFWLK